MARYLRVSEQASADILEIALQRASFDLPSACKYASQVVEKGKEILPFPEMHGLVFSTRDKSYRRFFVKGTTVLYSFDEEEVLIVRVFGPGRNWQEEL